MHQGADSHAGAGIRYSCPFAALERTLDFATLYPWLKSVHIIFVIYWMAGMFMLPRYFAYHAECEAGSAEDLKWREREAKLMKIIINPAIVVVWVLGLWLAIGLGVLTEPWFLIKLLIVTGLSGLHGVLSRWRKDFAAGNNTRDSRFYRIVNEVGPIAVIFIVIMVVVKPFS